MKKKIKPIYLIIVIIITGVILYSIKGTSFSSRIQNENKLTFYSDDSWLPGTTIKKDFSYQNNNNLSIVVRAKIEEEWISANGNKLDGYQNNNKASLLSINSNWKYQNGYYYYKNILINNDKTSSIVDSITFNKEITNDSICATSEDGKSETCTSSGNGYDGAKYKMEVTFEVLDAKEYQKIWSIDLTELEE